MRKMSIDPSLIMCKVPRFVVFIRGIRRDTATDRGLNYLQNQTLSGVVDAYSRPDLRKPIDSPLKFVAELDHRGTRTGNRRKFSRIWSWILGRNYQGQRELKPSPEWRLESEFPRRHFLIVYGRKV
jgi:hypothetical protein